MLSRAGTEGGRRGRDGGEGFRIVRGKRERAEGEEGGMGGEERDRMRRELYGIHSSSSVVPPTYVTNTYMRPNKRHPGTISNVRAAHRNAVFSYYRMCFLTRECVLLPENVFSY